MSRHNGLTMHTQLWVCIQRHAGCFNEVSLYFTTNIERRIGTEVKHIVDLEITSRSSELAQNSAGTVIMCEE